MGNKRQRLEALEQAHAERRRPSPYRDAVQCLYVVYGDGEEPPAEITGEEWEAGFRAALLNVYGPEALEACGLQDARRGPKIA